MIKVEKLSPDGSVQETVKLEDGRWRITLSNKCEFFVTGEYIIPSNPNLEKDYVNMLNAAYTLLR